METDIVIPELLRITDWTDRGEWSPRCSMPGVRCEVTAAAVGERMYVVGGQYEHFTNRPDVISFALQRCEYYEPARDLWRACAPIPEPRDHCALAVVDQLLYEFGGFTGAVHQGASERSFVYDTKADVWSEIAPMKVKRGSAGAAVVDGLIHVIGGRGLNNRETLAAHEVYDPRTDRWSDAAPMPKARDHMAVVAAENKIHVIGGRTSGASAQVDWHQVYDPSSDRWNEAPALPTARSAVAGVLYKGKILVVGGELTIATGGKMSQPYYCYVDNEAFDVAEGRWTTLRPLPRGRHAHGAAVIGDTAYFVGGSYTPNAAIGSHGSTDELLAFVLP